MKVLTNLAAAVVLIAGFLVGHPAHADPRLDERVYSPYVENGLSELEFRYGQVRGGPLAGQAKTVFELEQGVSDRLSLALVGAVVNGDGGGTRLTKIGVEGVYYLGRLPRLGIDAGLYLEYAKGLNGETNGGEAKLLLARTSGRFQGLLNLIVEHPFGAPQGQGVSSYGYVASATWETVRAIRLGVEAIGDLGDDHRFLGRQQAYLGPQLKWEGHPGRSPVELEVDIGWLAAIGSRPREAASQVHVGFELARRF